MDKRNRDILDLATNLEEAERILRNRRYFAEADAVHMMRQVGIQLMLEAYEKDKESKND